MQMHRHFTKKRQEKKRKEKKRKETKKRKEKPIMAIIGIA
eukprot:COSAG06_NODE_71198_length_187_cov_15.170455_1_plen_39_part_10